ncbi:sugar ABC transporter ATP-binding protein [Kaistia sp. 32K]|uniref:ATP-binding cassette domain-containing protein n=1 Tax=Kaistia sp. 32K TaxID=2795690 RepID=UPI0019166CFE|nr:ATP-binding cassette domain-containing protein [Kaistia sp. 32K]BCP53989.1 sugar ABC transporter ATP-binding protein [Kaistia sp. 32K]
MELQTSVREGHGAKPGADELLLDARGISKHYGGVAALDGVNFSIRPGEHVALVGDNGAGKSTLVRALTGAIRPDSGTLRFDGQDCQFASPVDARKVGIETVYQNLALADHLDVASNLFLGREEFRLRLGPLSLLAHDRMKKKAVELLARTGVHIPRLGDAVLNLSGGQRQTVAIARAVGWGSRLVIMDEPTAALGVQETKHVEDIIKRLKEQGMAVLIISHNLRQVFELCETVWIMRRGRVAGSRKTATTTPEEVIRLITGANEIAAA